MSSKWGGRAKAPSLRQIEPLMYYFVHRTSQFVLKHGTLSHPMQNRFAIFGFKFWGRAKALTLERIVLLMYRFVHRTSQFVLKHGTLSHPMQNRFAIFGFLGARIVSVLKRIVLLGFNFLGGGRGFLFSEIFSLFFWLWQRRFYFGNREECIGSCY